MSWQKNQTARTARMAGTCQRLSNFLKEADAGCPGPAFSRAFRIHLTGLEAEDDFVAEAFPAWQSFLRTHFDSVDLADIEAEQIERAVAVWSAEQRRAAIDQLREIADLMREGHARLHRIDITPAYD